MGRDYHKEGLKEKERISRLNVKVEKELFNEFLEKLEQDKTYKDRTDWVTQNIKKYLEKM